MLSDENKRREYDQFGKSFSDSSYQGGHHGFSFNFDDFYKKFNDYSSFRFKSGGSRHAHQGRGRNGGFSFFDDLFSDFDAEEEGFFHSFGSHDSFFSGEFRNDINMHSKFFSSSGK